ncbi:FAD dependent oxidoreductase domain-containing protein [Sinorhizobium fredii]|uniref:FAD dependent oxidoreductase domain-containing protein n=1 Tax=Rhizobium fredii TaxID=380 RepID=A0A2L0H7T2_RHIFR|nr:FAD dependent oxidoreductase domain-containing protein [Sinorhizobium fredii]
MKFLSYWHDTAPAFAPVYGYYDVAVIGGGFTGLGAARQLARARAKVAVLEAKKVGWGASGRNGGHLNNGLARSYLRFG